MRNLSFYTTTYLNTRLDMHEKALAKRAEEQESLEKKLMDLRAERRRLLQELNKHRELGQIREARDYSMSQSQKDIMRTTEGTKAAPTGGRGGAGNRVNVVSNMKNAQDYANAIQQYIELGMDAGTAVSKTQNELSGHHANRVINEIIKSKPQNAVAQAGLIAGELSFLEEDVRSNVVDQFNDAMSAAGIQGFFLKDDGSLDKAAAEAGAQAANTPQGREAATRAYNEIQRTIGLETTTEFSLEQEERRKQYDRTVRDPIQQGLAKLDEDILRSEQELNASASSKLEFELGPGYRPFAPMFANIRAQRAQLRAMRGMSPEDKQVYGLTYDYLKNNRNFAEDSSAMQIASKMEPANSADLLNKARQQAQSGAASVDDIIQAYIQIKQAASQGQASLGMIAADAATEEVASNLQASVEEEVRLVNEVGSELDRAYIDSQSIVSSGPKEIITEEPDTSTAGNFRESPFPDDQHLMVLNDDGSDTYRDAGTGETYQVKNRNTRTNVPVDTYTRMWAANPGMTKEKYDNLSSEEKAALDKLYGP